MKKYFKYFLIFSLISIAFSTTQTITVTVDENGSATAYIKGLLENEQVQISAKTSDPLVPAKDGSVIIKNYVSEVELPTFESTLYGTHANTADYKENFTVTASNLMPGTSVKWSATNGITPVSETTVVAEDGTTSVEFNANADYAVKTTDITMEYDQSGSGIKLTDTKTLSFYQYSLTLTTDKTEIVGDEQYVATLSGGKPGEAVTWTVTGDSQLVSKQDKFDSNGKATYTAQGKSPFTQLNAVKAETVFDALEKNVEIKNYVSIDYQFYLMHGTGGHAPGTLTNAQTFEVKQWNNVYAFEIDGMFEYDKNDTVSLYVNNNLLFSESYRPWSWHPLNIEKELVMDSSALELKAYDTDNKSGNGAIFSIDAKIKLYLR